MKTYRIYSDKIHFVDIQAACPSAALDIARKEEDIYMFYDIEVLKDEKK